MRPTPPPRPGRVEPREIVALNQLKADQPDLATAVDLQIDLFKLQRRVQSRVPLPSLKLDTSRLDELQAAGRPLLKFEEIPLDWSDLRLMIRETAAAMRRHDALDEEDFRRADALARDAERLRPTVAAWYRAMTGDRSQQDGQPPSEDIERLDTVLGLAMRPYLTRCAEAVQTRADLSAWTLGRCPVCLGEPEFALITTTADRLLICGRCTMRWAFDPIACPFCSNVDRHQITSFASRDGIYRIYGCDVCRRYLKAYDARHATRPVLLPVDLVATLRLDAAAIQKGYL